MGASSSKPKYPFPVPAQYDSPLPSKSVRWPSLSMSKRRKKDKDREKYDDFIIPKYPAQTTAGGGMYGLPYYQPTYYAPVILQPVGQPFFPMPQQYVQMPAFSAPAHVQAPAIQMPVPAPISAPASMPVPAPTSATGPVIPPLPSAPPSAPTQMPQPHPIHEHLTQGPVIPTTPAFADPVIPPPPILASEPPTTADMSRPRFTGFYRPSDLPPMSTPANGTAPMPIPMPEPARRPTPGPSGRTPSNTSMPIPNPSSTPMQMPTSMPTASRGNPLPPPPADVWMSSPYRQVLANLPTDISTLLDVQSSSTVLVSGNDPVPRPSSRLGALFGSSSNKDKGKGPLSGLFRSRSTSVHGDIGSSSVSRHGHGHGRSQTMTSIVIPAPALSMPVPNSGPPIRFDHTGDYAGFVNHSHHRVMYKNKMYPTALHLLEAMKFTHRPDLQERIRSCKDVHDMYPLSASFQEHVRPDWGQVFLQIMEDVLYLKFKQHPNLRALLLDTGLMDVIYKDENTYWGEGPEGEGANELGKALVRVRERLRQEGER